MAKKRFTPDGFIDYVAANGGEWYTVIDDHKVGYSARFIKDVEFSIMFHENILIEIEINEKTKEFSIKKNATLKTTKETNAYLNEEEE